MSGMNMPKTMLEMKTLKSSGHEIVVSQASVLHGMRRSRVKMMELEAIQKEREEAGRAPDEAFDDLELMRAITYPDLVAATLVFDGAPWETMKLPAVLEAFPFSSMLDLTDALLTRWTEAVYALNPHWLGLEEEDAQKKS